MQNLFHIFQLMILFRLNGEFMDREKVDRGLKIEDSSLINGYQIFHNYIRQHQSLDGKTPMKFVR